LSGRMSPSPISSPHTASGSSTPLSGGCGAIPFHHAKQPITCLQGSIGMIPRSQSSFYPNSSSPYQEPKPDLFRGVSQASCVFREIISSEYSALGNQLGQPELYDRHPVLADRVSQQLLREHMKLKPSLDLNPNSSIIGHSNGI